jgi:hypothetical protein
MSRPNFESSTLGHYHHTIYDLLTETRVNDTSTEKKGCGGGSEWRVDNYLEGGICGSI